MLNNGDHMYSLQNAEISREIITSAVTAFCDLRTDACLTIDIGFEQAAKSKTHHEIMANTCINIIKAQNHVAPNRENTKWCEEDQRLIIGAEGDKNGVEEKMSAVMLAAPDPRDYWKTVKAGWSTFFKKPSNNETEKCKPKNEYIPKKLKAIRREIPSGEFYAVKYLCTNKRKLNFRKTAAEVHTAQEVLAIREKGDANDLTERDCTSLKTSTDSRESLFEDTIRKIIEEVSPLRKAKKTRSETSTSAKASPAHSPISIKQRPDCGDLEILEETNGIVTFLVSTRHLEKKSKKNKSK